MPGKCQHILISETITAEVTLINPVLLQVFDLLQHARVIYHLIYRKTIRTDNSYCQSKYTRESDISPVYTTLDFWYNTTFLVLGLPK